MAFFWKAEVKMIEKVKSRKASAEMRYGDGGGTQERAFVLPYKEKERSFDENRKYKYWNARSLSVIKKEQIKPSPWIISKREYTITLPFSSATRIACWTSSRSHPPSFYTRRAGSLLIGKDEISGWWNPTGYWTRFFWWDVGRLSVPYGGWTFGSRCRNRFAACGKNIRNFYSFSSFL